jgi:hypothetical protein
MRDKQHAGHRFSRAGPVPGGRELHLSFATGERGDFGSGRPKGAARCPIESRKRGAVKSGCHAGFDACSGDRTLLGTRRKPHTRSGELNLGGRSPRTRIGRPWACCLSCTARVGGGAASSSSANRMPASPGRDGGGPTPPQKRWCFARHAGARAAPARLPEIARSRSGTAGRSDACGSSNPASTTLGVSVGRMPPGTTTRSGSRRRRSGRPRTGSSTRRAASCPARTPRRPAGPLRGGSTLSVRNSPDSGVFIRI